MLRTQEQLSQSANKAHKLVIWTVKFYTWTILLTGGSSFKLRDQEGNKSANHEEE